jgi:hypothetical protein
MSGNHCVRLGRYVGYRTSAADAGRTKSREHRSRQHWVSLPWRRKGKAIGKFDNDGKWWRSVIADFVGILTEDAFRFLPVG